jgi:hypothetical protein
MKLINKIHKKDTELEVFWQTVKSKFTKKSKNKFEN